MTQSLDKEKQADLRRQVKELNGELGELQNLLAGLASREKVARGQIARIVDETERLKQMGSEKTRLQTKLKGRQDMLPTLEKQIAAMDASIAKLKADAGTRRKVVIRELQAQATLAQHLAPLAEQYSSTLLSLYDTTIEVKTLEERMREVLDRQKVEVERLERLRAEADALKARARELLNAAKTATGSDVLTEAHKVAFQQFPDELDQLQQRIHEEKARLECHAKVNPEVIEQYHRREAEIAELDTANQALRVQYDKLVQSITEKKETWLPRLQNLVSRASTSFSEYFSQLHCVGQVTLREHAFDFSLYGIEIRVKFRQADDLQILTAHHHSGGERSVSTMLYLMALQALTVVRALRGFCVCVFV